jgi:hypothetical protein
MLFGVDPTPVSVLEPVVLAHFVYSPHELVAVPALQLHPAFVQIYSG